MVGGDGAGHFGVGHAGADAAELAADGGGHLALLFGDGDDVALGLALDAQGGEGVVQHHQLAAGDAQEDDVGVAGGVGERAVEDGGGGLADDGDLHGGFGVDPAGFEQCADVAVFEHVAELEEAVGDAADAAVGVVGGDGGEAAVGGFDPEDAAGGDAAGASVGGGGGHGVVESGQVVGRAVGEADGERGVGEAEGLLQLGGEVGPVSRGGHRAQGLPSHGFRSRSVREIGVLHAV